MGEFCDVGGDLTAIVAKRTGVVGDPSWRHADRLEPAPARSEGRHHGPPTGGVSSSRSRHPGRLTSPLAPLPSQLSTQSSYTSVHSGRTKASSSGREGERAMLLTITSTTHPRPTWATCCTRTRAAPRRSSCASDRRTSSTPRRRRALHGGPAAGRRSGRPGARPRRRRRLGPRWRQYVNDRPYVASSFLSVAIAQVFGTALAGRSRERGRSWPRRRCRWQPGSRSCPAAAARRLLRRLFEPLGYAVTRDQLPAGRAFPDWGDEPLLHGRAATAPDARATCWPTSTC